MSTPRRQHYIPQFLLRNFTDSDHRLCYLDQTKANVSIKKPTPKECFRECHLYTSYERDGKRNYSLDNDNTKLESLVSPIIKKILRACRACDEPKLSENEKTILDDFIINLWTRNPDIMKRVGLDDFYNDVVQKTVAGIEARRPLHDSEKELLCSPDRQKQLKQNVKVEALKIGSPKLKEVLDNKGLAIVKIQLPNKSFIIGSYPLARLNKGHLSEPTVELWLPIAHDIAIAPYFDRGIIKVFSINMQGIRKINMAIARQSSGIAGRSRELISSLARPR